MRRKNPRTKKTPNEVKFSGAVARERIKSWDFSRPAPEVIARYMKIDDLTSTVSDILDREGIRGAIPGSVLQPIIPGKKIAGPATTARHGPERKEATRMAVDRDRVRLGMRDVREVARPGDVLVYDGGGQADVSSGGHLAALFSKVKGFAGSIFDCGVRDVDAIRELDYPTWARGVTPITGKYRFETLEINGPVVIAGVQVLPGDLILADTSGVVVVPREKIEDVLIMAEEAATKEDELMKAIRRGASLEELNKILSMERW
ncbi:MAG: RraA family protein [Deltaproteobacteria bacterium]|nr:RraA family protein [Deltaproteobacteria bacterium]MBW2305661.1 RraA family protein [Deltaproteobacteria bacterium]